MLIVLCPTVSVIRSQHTNRHGAFPGFHSLNHVQYYRTYTVLNSLYRQWCPIILTDPYGVHKIMQHDHDVLGMIRLRIPGCKDIRSSSWQATGIEHLLRISEEPDTGTGSIRVWMLVDHTGTPVEDTVQYARGAAHLPGLYT